MQDFEDMHRMAEALDRVGASYSWHKVIPFIGKLEPEPLIDDPNDVVLFGSYTLWRYAEKRVLRPGVFKIGPFVRETAWHPFLLNGANALFSRLCDLPRHLEGDERQWFMRPVSDSKEEPGRVRTSSELLELVRKVTKLEPHEIVVGALNHDTELMLAPPAKIQKEWRLWVVGDQIVTYSLSKEGRRIVYRAEIDDDALVFARQLVAANPGYATAYVLDICLTLDGLKMLETNCINAAGFYAADLHLLVNALESM
ncbi:MAG: ATP-grasp domain-containing protein [Litoreibacter sp.]|nr:ATP-grasp domain-containing protein [Litoreibacter sp.]